MMPRVISERSSQRESSAYFVNETSPYFDGGITTEDTGRVNRFHSSEVTTDGALGVNKTSFFLYFFMFLQYNKSIQSLGKANKQSSMTDRGSGCYLWHKQRRCFLLIIYNKYKCSLSTITESCLEQYREPTLHYHSRLDYPNRGGTKHLWTVVFEHF